MDTRHVNPGTISGIALQVGRHCTNAPLRCVYLDECRACLVPVDEVYCLAQLSLQDVKRLLLVVHGCESGLGYIPLQVSFASYLDAYLRDVKVALGD